MKGWRMYVFAYIHSKSLVVMLRGGVHMYVHLYVTVRVCECVHSFLDVKVSANLAGLWHHCF